MDRATAKELHDDMMAALQPVAEKHGMEIVKAGGNISPTVFLAKFEVCEVSNDGVAQTRERTDFAEHANSFGLKPGDLGRTFISNGIRYTIVGLKPGRSKYPIIGETATGKRYKFSADKVAAALAVKVQPKRRSQKGAKS